tara:strand:+ start:107 stop:361 length:255 start_codon:yes stop_codon:yes gene_type:complete
LLLFRYKVGKRRSRDNLGETITDQTEALAAVKNDTDALEHVSDELKADKEVVMAAVNDNGYALEFASDELKADPDIIKADEQNL